MSDIAVSVQGLGKRYRIAHERDRYGRLTETLAGAFRAPMDRLRGKSRATEEWIWALQDVSFSLRRGEVIGVIGRNGAGKSTLLKILSRITEPSSGKAELHGRVASLLEVGTGFHPELTGRENVYMSAAVLGMRRAEISRRFDEIVSFAGIERFLDTPIKRYSSGMQVRLGFAVAAHLEPDVLLIDEVLAVGDAEFQRRCLGKIEEFGGSGRTVVFVSHSMPSVQRLCSNAVLLDRGTVVDIGPTGQVVGTYLNGSRGSATHRKWENDADAPGDQVARLGSVSVVTVGGVPADEVDIREPVDIVVEYVSQDPMALRPTVNIHVYNEDGIRLFVNSDWNDHEWWVAPRRPGTIRATCRIPGNYLAEGRFTVEAVVSTFDPLVVHAREPDAVAFSVVDRSDGDGVRGPFTRDWPGVVRPMLDWHVEIIDQPRRGQII